MERRNAWKSYNETDLAALEAFSADYRAFLDAGKTERECVAESVRIAEAKGFADMTKVKSAKPGDRLYMNWMGKSIMLFVVGRDRKSVV